MENLDGTVIATAMPQMARSFGASPVDLNVGMTAYLLAFAVFIPMSGWLADRFGARPVFASAIGLFTGSSVLCGLSDGLWEFAAMLRLLTQVLDQLLVNEEGVWQLWRLDL
jgi:MFS family permease